MSINLIVAVSVVLAAVVLGMVLVFRQRLSRFKKLTLPTEDNEAEFNSGFAEKEKERQAAAPQAVTPKEKRNPQISKPNPITGFTTANIEVEKELVYAAGPDQQIVLKPGIVEMSFRTSPELKKKDSNDHTVMSFEWRLADSEGRLWESRLWLLSAIFNDPWYQPWVSPRPTGYQPWRDAPQEWNDAMEEHCLLTKISEYMDSRDVLRLEIGGVTREIFMKHQGSDVDVAFIQPSSRILVRTSGLFETTIEDGTDEPDRDEMEAFAFEMLLGEFLPSHNPHYYFTEWQEWNDVFFEEMERNPFTFSMIGTDSEGQSQVYIRKTMFD